MIQQDFSVMHGWMIGKINNNDLANITIAELLLEDLTPYGFRNEETLSAKALDVIKEYILEVSHLELINLQFLGFRAAIESMLSFTSLNEEGRFSIQNGITEGMAAVNTLFSNVLIDGGRMIKACGRILNTAGETTSSEYALWKKVTNYLYDNDLVYMLSCKLRDIYEHEILILNYTSVNIADQYAYAVLDLTHELLSKKMPTTHSKIVEFVEYRKSVNQKPKYNIGTFIQNYFAQIQCLYTLFVFVQVARIEQSYTNMLNCFQFDDKRSNCLVIRNVDKKGFPEIGIILIRAIEESRGFPDALEIKGIQDLCDLIDQINSSESL